MKKIIFMAVFLVLSSVSLQAEQQQASLPDGQGKDLVQSKCSACHGLDFILHGSYSGAQWVKIVEDMVKAGLKVTPEEKNTITTYLASHFSKGTGSPMPPVPAGSETKQPETAAVPEHTLAQTLYEKNCAFCHRNKGTGIEGAMPPLAGNQAIAKESRYNIQTVLYGLSGQITVLENLYNGSMPGFSHLTDQEIAEIINYYTIAWDNKADFQAVKDSDVAAERKTAQTPDKVRDYRAELCKEKK